MVDRQQSLATISKICHRSKTISREDEAKLVAEAQQGDNKARGKLVNANLRFIYSVACKFMSPMDERFPDVFQVGCMGFITAIERFDLNREFKLISYAVWWIRQSITFYLNSDNLIHIPQNLVLANQQYRKKHKRQISEGTLPPTLPNIPRVVKIDMQPSSPLDSSDVNGQENAAVIAAIQRAESTNFVSPEQEQVDSDKERMIEQWLGSVLDTRERQVLTCYFGLADNNQWTLQEIGNAFNISRERVRQIRDFALKKIRARVELQTHKNANLKHEMLQSGE